MNNWNRTFQFTRICLVLGDDLIQFRDVLDTEDLQLEFRVTDVDRLDRAGGPLDFLVEADEEAAPVDRGRQLRQLANRSLVVRLARITQQLRRQLNLFDLN